MLAEVIVLLRKPEARVWDCLENRPAPEKEDRRRLERCCVLVCAYVWARVRARVRAWL